MHAKSIVGAVAASLAFALGAPAQSSELGWCSPCFAHGFPVPFSGLYPSAVVAGDINNDDLPDLLVNGEVGGLRAFLGTATGELLPFGELAGIVTPSGVDLADLDHDGNFDLIVRPASAGVVRIYIGDGDAGFASLGLYPMSPAAPWGVDDVDVGDVNGDGWEDLVASDVTSRQLALRFGLGGGAFGPVSFVPLAGYPQQLALGDVDRDGDLDVVMQGAAISSRIGLLLGDGGGGFAPAVDLGINNAAFLLRDADRDGILDVLVAAGSGTNGSVRVFRGDGLGAFALFSVQSVGEPLRALDAGDFDGDGELDVATVAQLGATYLLRGISPGTFSAPVPLLSHTSVGGVHAVDLDLNGYCDLAALGSHSTLVLHGSPLRSLVQPLSFAMASPPRDVECADLDGDGARDVVVARDGDLLEVLRGDGALGFASVASVALASAPNDLALLDFDSDALLDVAVSSSAGQRIDLLRGIGGGALAAPVVLATGRSFSKLALADLDLDGALDLCCITAEATVDVVFASSVLPPPSVSIALPAAAVDLACGDVDGDGLADVVVAGSDQTSSWLRGTGTTLAAPATSVLGRELHSVALFDFDGDTYADAALGTEDDGIVVQRGTTSGLAPELVFGPPTRVRSMRARDVDGDGWEDLVFRSNELGAGSISARRGGVNGLAPIAGYWLADSATDFALADLDGDGALEIAVADASASVVRVSLRRKGPRFDDYCPAGTSVAGCSAALTGTGVPSSTSGAACVLSTTALDAQRSAITIWSTAFPTVQPWATGSTSLLCLGAPRVRSAVHFSAGTLGQCDGAIALDLNLELAFAAVPPGRFAFVQTWYRDPLAPRGGHLSNALALVVEP